MVYHPTKWTRFHLRKYISTYKARFKGKNSIALRRIHELQLLFEPLDHTLWYALLEYEIKSSLAAKQFCPLLRTGKVHTRRCEPLNGLLRERPSHKIALRRRPTLNNILQDVWEARSPAILWGYALGNMKSIYTLMLEIKQQGRPCVPLKRFRSIGK